MRRRSGGLLRRSGQPATFQSRSQRSQRQLRNGPSAQMTRVACTPAVDPQVGQRTPSPMSVTTKDQASRSHSIAGRTVAAAVIAGVVGILLRIVDTLFAKMSRPRSKQEISKVLGQVLRLDRCLEAGEDKLRTDRESSAASVRSVSVMLRGVSFTSRFMGTIRAGLSSITGRAKPQPIR